MSKVFAGFDCDQMQLPEYDLGMSTPVIMITRKGIT